MRSLNERYDFVPVSEKLVIDGSPTYGGNQPRDDLNMELDWMEFIYFMADLSEYEKQYIRDTDSYIVNLFWKVLHSYSQFRNGGYVYGYIPYPRQEDEVPAKIQHRSFVMTAKAVREIGADVLQELMERAERAADETEVLVR